MDPLLSVEGLKTHFFTSSGVVKAVDGVSFSLEKGGRLGIVGESGSGKSVTALSILRLVASPGRICGGRILFAGKDLLAIPEREMRSIRGGRIAMVFQEPSTSLNPVFTIGNQIEESLKQHRPPADRETRRGQVLEALTLVKIADPERVAKSYPHELSGGMKQRAMIAMALASRPDLLIADEPTTALDVTVQAQILDLVADLQAELGMALILITHDVGIIAETVEEVVVMQGGRIVEAGAAVKLFRQPSHPSTKKLMETYERLAGG